MFLLRELLTEIGLAIVESGCKGVVIRLSNECFTITTGIEESSDTEFNPFTIAHSFPLPDRRRRVSNVDEITRCVGRNDFELPCAHFPHDAAFKKQSLTTFRLCLVRAITLFPGISSRAT